MKNWQRIKNNPDLIPQYLLREQVIDAIRLFFKSHKFHEVETPLLVKSPGTEPYLEVFETSLKTATGDKQRAFLLTSPEYAMKKLLVAGLGNIFQICKSFRNNEGVGGRHNAEFSILEWYRPEADYFDIMNDVEQLMVFIYRQLKISSSIKNVKINPPYLLEYQGKTYDLTPPYPKMTVAAAFQQYVGINAEQLLSKEALIKVAHSKGYETNAQTTWEEVYNQLFLNEIESQLAKLKQPVFIYDYPASQAALSKKKATDPRFAERFEVYLAGLELGNAFSELNDAVEQAARLKEELALRKALGKVEYQLDEDFIQALATGMPDSGGIAMGVDRLIMLFANQDNIESTLFFPIKEVFDLD